MSLTEILGFITGAGNVWLLARQNIWNWPVGLANNALYVDVFLAACLYGDAGLQLVLGASWGARRVGGRADARDHVDLVDANDGRCGGGVRFLSETLHGFDGPGLGRLYHCIVARGDLWADQEIFGIVVAVDLG
jgi:hypothetical protein